MKAGGADADELQRSRAAELRHVGIEIGDWSVARRARGRSSRTCCCASPTRPMPDVPVGGEEASVIVRDLGRAGVAMRAGEPHWEVAETLGMFDLAAGAKVAGSGFPIYVGCRVAASSAR